MTVHPDLLLTETARWLGHLRGAGPLGEAKRDVSGWLADRIATAEVGLSPAQLLYASVETARRYRDVREAALPGCRVVCDFLVLGADSEALAALRGALWAALDRCVVVPERAA